VELTTAPKLSELRLRCLPYQAAVLQWPEAYGLVVGGRGAAKTRCAALQALVWLVQYPGIPFGVCADDFAKLKSNFMQEFDTLLAEIGWVHGREYVFNKGEKTYTTAWGSTLTGFTMDKPPEKTKGPTLGGVIFDECDQISQEHYEIFEICARHPHGPRQRRLFANGTPPSHWLNKHFDPIHGATRPDHRMARVSSYVNRFLPASELRQLERRYPHGSLQNRRWIWGEAVAMAGALWPEFGSQHIFQPSALPRGANLHANGLDLGYRDPYAYVRARVDGAGAIWITGEYQQAELSAIDQAPRIRALYEAGPIFSDHDASERATLASLGIDTVLAQKEITYGIELVRQLIINGFLHVAADCVQVIEAMQNSMWNPKGARELPLHDRFSHLASAVRYLCVGVWAGRSLEEELRRIGRQMDRRTLV
jgi:phage terminase large subunit